MGPRELAVVAAGVSLLLLALLVSLAEEALRLLACTLAIAMVVVQLQSYRRYKLPPVHSLGNGRCVITWRGRRVRGAGGTAHRSGSRGGR